MITLIRKVSKKQNDPLKLVSVLLQVAMVFLLKLLQTIRPIMMERVPIKLNLKTKPVDLALFLLVVHLEHLVRLAKMVTQMV